MSYSVSSNIHNKYVLYHTCLLARQGWMLYPAPMGALTQLYAGTTAEALNLNGRVCWFTSSTPMIITDMPYSICFRGLGWGNHIRARTTRRWRESFGSGWRTRSKICNRRPAYFLAFPKAFVCVSISVGLYSFYYRSSDSTIRCRLTKCANITKYDMVHCKNDRIQCT